MLMDAGMTTRKSAPPISCAIWSWQEGQACPAYYEWGEWQFEGINTRLQQELGAEERILEA